MLPDKSCKRSAIPSILEFVAGKFAIPVSVSARECWFHVSSHLGVSAVSFAIRIEFLETNYRLGTPRGIIGIRPATTRGTTLAFSTSFAGLPSPIPRPLASTRLGLAGPRGFPALSIHKDELRSAVR